LIVCFSLFWARFPAKNTAVPRRCHTKFIIIARMRPFLSVQNAL